MRVTMLLASQELRQVAAQSVCRDSQQADKIESLRSILIAQTQAEVGYEEAQEVAASLIAFYEILASEGERTDEPTS